MKHIKHFELYHTENDDLDLSKFKFKNGDIVKTTSSFDPRLYQLEEDRLKGFFTVTLVNDDEKSSLRYIISNDKKHISIWVKESDIEFVSDEEVDAYKYNL